MFGYDLNDNEYYYSTPVFSIRWEDAERATQLDAADRDTLQSLLDKHYPKNMISTPSKTPSAVIYEEQIEAVRAELREQVTNAVGRVLAANTPFRDAIIQSDRMCVFQVDIQAVISQSVAESLRSWLDQRIDARLDTAKTIRRIDKLLSKSLL